MVIITEDQLSLYLSLFRGRTDVYAKRWEKREKSGYAPAYQFDWNEFLAHSFDQTRNQLVLDDIKRSLVAGQKTLVLSERKEHLEVLHMYLKGTCEAILITGDDSTPSRKSKFAQIHSGHFTKKISLSSHKQKV